MGERVNVFVSDDGCVFMIREREMEAARRDGLAVSDGPDLEVRQMRYLARVLAQAATAGHA